MEPSREANIHNAQNLLTVLFTMEIEILTAHVAVSLAED